MVLAVTRLLAAALLLQGAEAFACPICLGWGQPSQAQQLVNTPQAVLALATADAGRFRVTEVIKGERPADGVVEGDYPRNAHAHAVIPTHPRALLLLRDDPLPSWVILGAIDATRADWLRALAAGKRTEEMSPDDWRDRVALVLPYLNDSEPLAVELAYAELGAAPYTALRTAKPLLDPAALRRCLADPQLAEHHPISLLLLGIAGDAQDASALENRLQAAWQSGDAASLSSMLAADLELNGGARVAWIESHYLADANRTTPEIEAALLALSVHGNADATIPRERVIQAYRVFMNAHPEIAGDVAPDLAAWRYWDAVPDYLALLESSVRQQYPSRLAILAYLQQSPNALSSGLSPETTPADANAAPWNPPLPRP